MKQPADVIKIINIVEKFSIEALLVKELILSGIDTEEKLIDLFTHDKSIMQPMKVKLHNCFRDIERNIGVLKFKNIPIVFKT